MRQPAAMLLAMATVFGFAAPARGDTVGARILDFGFMPNDVSIGAGDEVVWTNGGGAAHSVVAADPGSPEQFDSGDLPHGASFARTFERVGTFPYHCRIHPPMRGVVRVLAPGTVTPGATPTTTGPR